MILDLISDGGGSVLIKIDGRLACEVATGEVSTRGDLIAEIRAARKLKNVPRILAGAMHDLGRIADMPDHVHTTPPKKRDACLRGLVDGFTRRTVPHPFGAGVPPINPDSTLSYGRGYEIGEALARCVTGDDIEALLKEEGKVA